MFIYGTENFPGGHSGSYRRVEVTHAEGVCTFLDTKCRVFQRPAVVVTAPVHKT